MNYCFRNISQLFLSPSCLLFFQLRPPAHNLSRLQDAFCRVGGFSVLNVAAEWKFSSLAKLQKQSRQPNFGPAYYSPVSKEAVSDCTEYQYLFELHSSSHHYEVVSTSFEEIISSPSLKTINIVARLLHSIHWGTKN